MSCQAELHPPGEHGNGSKPGLLDSPLAFMLVRQGDNQLIVEKMGMVGRGQQTEHHKNINCHTNSLFFLASYCITQSVRKWSAWGKKSDLIANPSKQNKIM